MKLKRYLRPTQNHITFVLIFFFLGFSLNHLLGQEIVVRFDAPFVSTTSRNTVVFPSHLGGKRGNDSEVFIAGNFMEINRYGVFAEDKYKAKTFLVYRTDQTYSKTEVNTVVKGSYNDLVKEYSEADKTLKKTLKEEILSSLEKLEIGEDKIEAISEEIMEKVQRLISQKQEEFAISFSKELQTQLLDDKEFLKRLKKKIDSNE